MLNSALRKRKFRNYCHSGTWWYERAHYVYIVNHMRSVNSLYALFGMYICMYFVLAIKAHRMINVELIKLQVNKEGVSLWTHQYHLVVIEVVLSHCLSHFYCNFRTDLVGCTRGVSHLPAHYTLRQDRIKFCQNIKNNPLGSTTRWEYCIHRKRESGHVMII